MFCSPLSLESFTIKMARARFTTTPLLIILASSLIYGTITTRPRLIWLAEAAIADLSQEWVLSPLYNSNRGSCNVHSDVVDILGQTIGNMVVQNGEVVAEAYHEEEDRYGYFDSMSLTKSWPLHSVDRKK